MKGAITVFGNSSPTPQEYNMAYEVGKIIGKYGFTLINGGYSGTMEATARGVKEYGGDTVGITVKEFGSVTPNKYIDKNIVAETLCQRLEILVERGNSYIVLPGSTGTLTELCLVWEKYNKGAEKIILVHNFWEKTIESVRIKKRKMVKFPEDFSKFLKSLKEAKMFISQEILKSTEFLCKYLSQSL